MSQINTIDGCHYCGCMLEKNSILDFTVQRNCIVFVVIVVKGVYSFLPVYGISKWYNRKGEVDENALTELLQDVSLKVPAS